MDPQLLPVVTFGLGLLGDAGTGVLQGASWDGVKALYHKLTATSRIDFDKILLDSLSRAVNEHSRYTDHQGGAISRRLLDAVRDNTADLLAAFAIVDDRSFSQFMSSIDDGSYQKSVALRLRSAYFRDAPPDDIDLLTDIIRDVLAEYRVSVVTQLTSDELLRLTYLQTLKMEELSKVIHDLEQAQREADSRIRDSLCHLRSALLARSVRIFANVPPQAAPLVGRTEELGRLRNALARGGKMAITAVNGAPGVGKTALAAALVYDDAVLQHFSGGVLWANLGPEADPQTTLARWATALRTELPSEGSVNDQTDALNVHVQRTLPGPVLIVVDDAWRFEDASPFLRFTAPGNALLLTTRDASIARSFAPEDPLVVHELSLDNAIDLLVRRCPEALELDPGAVSSLAQEVGRLPLALVLMGAYLHEHRGQPRWIRSALEHLRSAEARLSLREKEPRHGMAGVPLCLQAVIELSVDALLDDDTRSAFSQLAAFAPKPANFSAQAAFATWQTTPSVGDGCLRTLCDRGLLETAGEDRFAVHQLLAAAAGARLAEPQQARERHADYYLGFIQSADGDWRSIDPEFPQVRFAVNWLRLCPGQEVRLCNLVGTARTHVRRRGASAECVDWFLSAAGAGRILGRLRMESVFLTEAGLACARAGHLPAAEEIHRKALRIDEELGSKEGMAADYANLGSLYKTRGDLGSAEVMVRKALAINEELGRRDGVAIAYSNLGSLYLTKSELTVAEEMYRKALAIDEELGRKEGMAANYGNLGVLYLTRSALNMAEEMYTKALAVNEELGRKEGVAKQYGNLGIVYQTRGNLDVAEEMHRQALAIDEELGRKEGMASALGNLGNVYLTKGELTVAEEMYRKALAIDEELGRKEGMAANYGNLGNLYLKQSDLEKAEEMYNKALAINEGLGRREGMAKQYGNLGNLWLTQGQYETAEEVYRKALAIAEELGSKEGIAINYGNLGVLYETRGDMVRAERMYRKSLDLATAIGAAGRAAWAKARLEGLGGPTGDSPQATP